MLALLELLTFLTVHLTSHVHLALLTVANLAEAQSVI
jgi:hypothetical protein